MQFYPKKINNLEELKREKKALKKLREETSIETLGNLDTYLPNEKGGDHREDIAGTVLSAFSSRNLISAALSFVPLAFQIAGGGIKKSVFRFLIKEVAGGYVKWQALKLGYRAAKSIVKRTARKKADA